MSNMKCYIKSPLTLYRILDLGCRIEKNIKEKILPNPPLKKEGARGEL
jgi:hypothetical protein